MLHDDLKNYKEEGNCVFNSDGVIIWALAKSEARDLSNVIQRDYMVRPRDNDGVPYHKGDRVWSIDPDTEYSAIVTNVSESYIEIKWEDDGGAIDESDPCDMTHKRPESIKAIIDDMRSTTDYYCVKGDPMYDEVSNWISRLEDLRDSGHC